MLDGTRSVKNGAFCIAWSYRPEDSCSVLVKRNGEMVLLKVDTDQLLGTVERIVPGSAERI